METIHNFNDFLQRLYEAGMSMGGGSDSGVFSLSTYFGEEIEWHSEKPDVDPWEWRMRVLEEKSDIVSGKLFFRKTGYLTEAWYPYFYSIRRGKKTLKEEYEAGLVSRTAKQIYEILSEYPSCPVHLLKSYGEFTGEDNTRFETALVDLQMKFYITVCGRSRKISKDGKEYGWNSNVYCRTEEFWGRDLLKKAAKIPYETAYAKIADQLAKLCPDAAAVKVKKFITG